MACSRASYAPYKPSGSDGATVIGRTVMARGCRHAGRWVGQAGSSVRPASPSISPALLVAARRQGQWALPFAICVCATDYAFFVGRLSAPLLNRSNVTAEAFATASISFGTEASLSPRALAVIGVAGRLQPVRIACRWSCACRRFFPMASMPFLVKSDSIFTIPVLTVFR